MSAVLPSVAFDVPGSGTADLSGLLSATPAGVTFRIGTLPDSVSGVLDGRTLTLRSEIERFGSVPVVISAAGYRDTTLHVPVRASRNCDQSIDPAAVEYVPRLTLASAPTYQYQYIYNYRYTASPSRRLSGVLRVRVTSASCTERSEYVARGESTFEGTVSTRTYPDTTWVVQGSSTTTNLFVMTERTSHVTALNPSYWHFGYAATLLFDRFLPTGTPSVLALTPAREGYWRCGPARAVVERGVGITSLDIGCNPSAATYVSESYSLRRL